jgi:hypothetical protein
MKKEQQDLNTKRHEQRNQNLRQAQAQPQPQEQEQQQQQQQNDHVDEGVIGHELPVHHLQESV